MISSPLAPARSSEPLSWYLFMMSRQRCFLRAYFLLISPLFKTLSEARRGIAHGVFLFLSRSYLYLGWWSRWSFTIRISTGWDGIASGIYGGWWEQVA